MPLTIKGRKILANMRKTYRSKEKAEEVMYASINAGKITGAERAKPKAKRKRGR